MTLKESGRAAATTLANDAGCAGTVFQPPRLPTVQFTEPSSPVPSARSAGPRLPIVQFADPSSPVPSAGSAGSRLPIVQFADPSSPVPSAGSAGSRLPTVQFADPPTPVGVTSRLRLHSSCSRPSIADKLSQMNLSFAGCGFLSVYHMGVAACMRRYCPELFHNRISGASAGALAAAALICETSLSNMMSDLIHLVTRIQKHIGGPFNPFISVSTMLRASLEKNLPADAHIRCSGRLHISVTRLEDSKNCILSQFDSKEHLIQALLCTSFIPIFSGWRPPLFCGVRYMDGCYSNNLPTLDNRTITVSPFCGEADVCPRDHNLSLIVMDIANTRVEVSAENLARVQMIMFPPSPEALSDLANQGFNDGIRFLMRHDLLKCQVCVLTTEIVGRAYSSCGQLIQHRHCNQCSHKQQEAMVARLPANIYEPLYRHIRASRRLFRNWVLDFPGARRMLVVGLPWSIPYRILKAVYLRLVSRLPFLGHMLDRLANEVIVALHSGFSAHLPEARQVHASYKCRVNVTEYGDAALSETESECSYSSDQITQSAPYVPGILRQYDRQFQVDFTNKSCGTSVVCTSSDVERLESELVAAGPPAAEGAASADGVPMVDSVGERLSVPADSFDREVIQLALEAQSQADCGVSWYYTDQDGNVRVKHVSAVATPVATPCVSRRASVCDELADLGSAFSASLSSMEQRGSEGPAAGLFPRRGSLDVAALADLGAATGPTGSGGPRRGSMDPTLLMRRGVLATIACAEEDQREEQVSYDAGMGTIKEESNDPLPEY